MPGKRGDEHLRPQRIAFLPLRGTDFGGKSPDVSESLVWGIWVLEDRDRFAVDGTPHFFRALLPPYTRLGEASTALCRRDVAPSARAVREPVSSWCTGGRLEDDTQS